MTIAPMMTDLIRTTPSDIAEYLIKDNGIDYALQAAYDGTTKAQRDGDNYTLSIWREVKTILHSKTS